MFRILFLILIVMSSLAFSQTAEKPEALMADEFGKVPNGHFRSVLDNFFVELQNNPDSQGLIINYGAKRELAARERLIKNHISFRKFPDSRISFINGGHSNQIKTQFWRVPQGAENPKPEPTAFIFDEFAAVTNANLKVKIENFYKELDKNPAFQDYIVNYGPNREVARRERLIRNSIDFRRTDDPASRIVFINGGKAGKLKTVIWLVPEGAEPPTP